MIDLKQKLFEVEHALSMYAFSYAVLPACSIYEKKMLEPLEGLLRKCHIYFIGLVPKVSIEGAHQEGRTLKVPMKVLDQHAVISVGIPADLEFSTASGLLIRKSDGLEQEIDRGWLIRQLCEKIPIDFEVIYIGQAYGKDGNRSAIDRLLKHETLQKISLQGVPEDYTLTLLLLEVIPNNRLVTVFNPHAKNSDDDGSRTKAGLDKLFGTTAHERISLYEAAMIRYFRPRFNVEFKDSFPSTNLAVLRDCYEKDFSAVVAEIVFDDLPWRLKSDFVAPAFSHLVRHDLHEAAERAMFFSIDSR